MREKSLSWLRAWCVEMVGGWASSGLLLCLVGAGWMDSARRRRSEGAQKHRSTRGVMLFSQLRALPSRSVVFFFLPKCVVLFTMQPRSNCGIRGYLKDGDTAHLCALVLPLCAVSA